MLQQAIDFRDESDALHKLVAPLDGAALAEKTQFKGWTVNDVIGHLHMWNWAADLSLRDGDAFQDFFKDVAKVLQSGGKLGDFEKQWLDGLSGTALVETWHAFYSEMTERFAAADPKLRVRWAGPDMSVLSSITARLMETWAHGQEVYDHLGVVRENADRIKNIAVLGVNTYGWTFKNRGEEPPQPTPFVRLTAPSGAVWTWNDEDEGNMVEGPAEEFCQVVTQVRNVADTTLNVVGANAAEWMSKAQCFAGSPETPPAPGTRFTRAA